LVKKFIMICLLAVGLNSLSVNAQKLTQVDLEEVFTLMSGSFSNQLQAKADTSFFDIRLHTKPMWKDKQGEYWLYLELAMSGRPQAPYKQRVYSFSLVDDNTIACKVYSFKGDATKYAGEWKKNEPLPSLTVDDLETRDGCTIYFHKTGRSIYDGSTKANNCANSMKGAAYATSTTHLDKVSMTTWDRGFDSSGKQVWGTVKGGYDFKKENAGR
jgi:CpeT protein